MNVVELGKIGVLSVQVLTLARNPRPKILISMKKRENIGYLKRYPRVFVGVTTTLAILILYSKPLFDFTTADKKELEQIARTHKSRFAKN